MRPTPVSMMGTAAVRFVLLFLCLSFADAATVESRSTIEGGRENIESTSRASICTHAGNTDLYGLGIRLGVYLQLFSTLIANHFLVETSQAAWDANAVFLVAIFIATVKASVGSNTIAAFESFVMLQMLLAFVLAVFNVTGRKWREFDLLLKHNYSRFNGSPLGSFTRSALTTSISCYQVWFWFRGADQLDRGAMCTTFVFLFTRVSIRSSVIIVFKIFALLYLVIRLVRFFWESPIGTVVKDYALWTWFRGYSGSRQFTLKKSLLDWYEPGGVLESVTLTLNNHEILFKARNDKAKQIDCRPHPTDRLAKDLDLAWHSITLSCSLVVILWSIVAIETTLVWNGVSQVYSISSTGQLIPLVTGIGGFIQAAVLLLTQWRSKRLENQRPARKVDLESGTWRYRLLNQQTAIFAASRPDRRWSVDAGASDEISRTQIPLTDEDRDHQRLAPVLPFHKADQDRRVQEFFYGQEIDVLRSTARSIYTSRNGGRHVFHHLQPRRGRRSFDMASGLDRARWPRPHRARKNADVPLRMKLIMEDAENERKKWYNEELTRLRKQWRAQETGDSSEIFSISSFIPGPWVQPANMDQQSMFSIVRGRKCRDGSRHPRRHSADDKGWAYSRRRGPLPFLDRRAMSSDAPSRSRNRSYHSGSSYYSGNSYHDSNDSGASNMISKLVTKIMRFFRQVAAAVVNVICCCAPCAIARGSLARRKRMRHFGSLQEAAIEPGGMGPASERQPARCMRCEECDVDFVQQASTRRRRRLDLAMYDESPYSAYLSFARPKKLASDALERWMDRLLSFIESRTLQPPIT